MMRQASGVVIWAAMLSAAVALGGVATAGEHGSGKTDTGCEVIHEHGGDGSADSDDGMSAGTKAGNVQSHVDMGHGGGSATTSVTGSTSSSVTAGGGDVTTTTTRNGKSVTVHSKNGGAASSSASSSDGHSVATGSNGDCVIIDRD